jgi:hypothetical protein
MYDLIQATLTNLIEFTAIAGFGGILAHDIWKRHATWIATYCPPVIPSTPEQPKAPEVAEVDATEPIAEVQPAPAPEVSEAPVIADPWETPIASSSRRWASRQSVKPVLALCPAKEEVKKVEVKPEVKVQQKVHQPEIDLNALDAGTLRKLCSQYGIAWRNVRGKNRHATKAMMIFQLNQKAVA